MTGPRSLLSVAVLLALSGCSGRNCNECHEAPLLPLSCACTCEPSCVVPGCHDGLLPWGDGLCDPSCVAPRGCCDVGCEPSCVAPIDCGCPVPWTASCEPSCVAPGCGCPGYAEPFCPLAPTDTAPMPVPSAAPMPDSGDGSDDGPVEPPAEEPVASPDVEVAEESGRDPGYRWVRGHLERVHVPGGDWRLRYAGIDEADEWGGSVMLSHDVRLEDFEEGDLVHVEGRIIRIRTSSFLNDPLYRIAAIRRATGVRTDVAAEPRNVE